MAAAGPLAAVSPWLIAAAFGLPVLALYVWFRRRQRAEVSYLRIWERVARLQRRSWWRWLRWLISLLLALTILGALVAAGAKIDEQPDRPPPGAPTSRHVVVLIDPTVSVATPGWSPPAAQAWLQRRLAELAAARQAARGDTLDVVWQTRSGVQLQPMAEADGTLPAAPQPARAAAHTADGIHSSPDWRSMLAAAEWRVEQRTTAAKHTGTIPRVEWLLISDGQPTPVLDDAAREPGLRLHRWLPDGDARAGRNVAIVGVEVRDEQIAITLEHTAVATPTDDGARPAGAPIAVRLTCDPPVVAPLEVHLAAGVAQVVSLPLPDQLSPSVERGRSGPHTWQLRIAVAPADGPGDARQADDTVALTLPVLEPVPVVVAGTGVDNPLVIPLIQLLQSRGICRLVRSRDLRPGDALPVLLQLDDLPENAVPPHVARIRFGTAVRAPGDLVTPGNLLEWPAGHGLFRVDDIASVPLAVRQARVFGPLTDATVPLIVGPHGAVADFTPAHDNQPALVRVGFSLSPSNSDFLLQPGLAPLFLKRLLRLVAPPVRPPLPPLIALGEMATVDFTPGSALGPDSALRGRVSVEVPGDGQLPLHLEMPAPPLRLNAGRPRWPGTARVRVEDRATWETQVQRLDAAESAVPAVPAADAGPRVAELFPPGDAAPSATEVDSGQPAEPWPSALAWLLLAVLAMALVESVLYRLRLAE